MNTQTQTVTSENLDRPATAGDVKSLFDTLDNKLNSAVEKIVEDQDTHAGRLKEHDAEIKEHTERISALEREMGVESAPVPFYKDVDFYKETAFTVGVAAVTVAAIGGVKALMNRKKADPEAESSDLDTEIALG